MNLSKLDINCNHCNHCNAIIKKLNDIVDAHNYLRGYVDCGLGASACLGESEQYNKGFGRRYEQEQILDGMLNETI